MVLLRTAVHGGKFADSVSISDFQPGHLGGVFFILRILAYGSELVYPVMFTDGGRPFNDHMRPDDGAGSDFNVGANDRIRPNADPFGYFRLGMDNRR